MSENRLSFPRIDPLTQFSVGAIAAVSIARKPTEVRHALVLGALAGGAPDLDIFIRSDADPLLALEYHRHFTHALIFAPLIGVLVASLYKVIFARKQPWGKILQFGIIATLTHGFIDACTSYGTMLYWPLSNHRESWDIISIIDPIFTVPLVVALIFAWCWKSRRPAIVGLVLACAYLSFGVYQREQAADFAFELATQRGHSPAELTVRPSLANVLLWRVVYRERDRYYVDAVWTFPGFEARHYPGESVPVFGEMEAYALVNPDSTLWHDIERFRFFSQNYLFLHGQSPLVAGDLRYAMYPDSVTPLWGIGIDPGKPDTPVEVLHFREMNGGAFDRLWKMIRGKPVATYQQFRQNQK
ncbi:MAG: metal-dependent hydrolase [Opitutales bacterium]